MGLQVWATVGSFNILGDLGREGLVLGNPSGDARVIC